MKTGLDDFLNHCRDAHIEHDIMATLRKFPRYIPTAAGAEPFASLHLESDNDDDRIDALGALIAIDDFKARQAEKRLFRGQALQRSARKMAQKRLEDSKKLYPRVVRGNGNRPSSTENTLSLLPEISELRKNLDGTDYSINSHGELIFYKEINGVPKPEKVANFVLKLTAITRRDDGQSLTTYYLIKGIAEGSKILPAQFVKAEEFADMRWVLERWGMRAIIYAGRGNYDHLRVATQFANKDAPEVTEYTHLGWHGRIFLHAGGAIGDDTVKVRLDDNATSLHKYSLPKTTENLEAAIQASLDLLDIGSPSVLMPLLSLVYLAPLLPLFQAADFSPGFVMTLWGETGTRKSSLAALFLCHYGHFTRDTLPAKFEGTPNSIEKLAYGAKDVVFVVDDRYPTSNKILASNMELIMERLLRGTNNRAGRSRLTSTTDFRLEYYPRGFLLATAEMSMRGASANARQVELTLREGDLDLSKMAACQSDTAPLAMSMRGYIEYIAANYDQIVEGIRTAYPEVRKFFSSNAAHGQIAEHMTALYLGLETFLNFAVENGVITAEYHKKRSEEFEGAMSLS